MAAIVCRRLRRVPGAVSVANASARIGSRASLHTNRPLTAAAAAVASAPGSTPGSVSASKWYAWGGGRDLRYAISGGATGVGGIPVRQDAYASRLPKPFAPVAADASKHVLDGGHPLSRIKQVAFGVHHTAILSEDGSVYMLGANKKGCLGLGAEQFKSSAILKVPIKLESLPPIKEIACGMYHTLALARDGSVWSWGWGGNAVTGGGLGKGEWSDSPLPAIIKVNGFDKQKIVSISAGHYHSLALNASGELHSWGAGDFGRLGLGGSGSEKAPALIASLAGIKVRKIVCGPVFNAAITDKNLLYTWGKNDAGQLGLVGGLAPGDMFNMESTPVLVEALHFREGQTVTDVACGEKHMLAVTSKQQVYQWGNHRNPTPQLVTGGGDSAFKKFRITSVAAGAAFSACTDVYGHVYSWGSSSSHCLGHRDSASFLNRFAGGWAEHPRRVPGFGRTEDGAAYGPAVQLTANFRKIAVQTGTLPPPPPRPAQADASAPAAAATAVDPAKK